MARDQERGGIHRERGKAEERDTERETETETERERNRQTCRQTDRQTDRERQRETERGKRGERSQLRYIVGAISSGGFTLQLVAEAVRRGRKIKCKQCGAKGATLGCLNRFCRSSYHLSCARASGCELNVRRLLLASQLAYSLCTGDQAQRQITLLELGYSHSSSERVGTWNCLYTAFQQPLSFVSSGHSRS
jgi:hypothetical protein